MKRAIRGLSVYLIIIMTVFVLMLASLNNSDMKMNYSEMLEAISTDNVKEITLSTENGKAIVTLNSNVQKEVNIPSTQQFVQYVQEELKSGKKF